MKRRKYFFALPVSSSWSQWIFFEWFFGFMAPKMSGVSLKHVQVIFRILLCNVLLDKTCKHHRLVLCIFKYNPRPYGRIPLGNQVDANFLVSLQNHAIPATRYSFGTNTYQLSLSSFWNVNMFWFLYSCMTINGIMLGCGQNKTSENVFSGFGKHCLWPFFTIFWHLINQTANGQGK